MSTDLNSLFAQLTTVYKKENDRDFPINKIRFYMDFLWNSLLAKPLTEEQKVSLKALIDLLNTLDDHKLSPTRELIQNMNATLGSLLVTYPSLGHSFTLIVTTVIPAYQRYLTSLEAQVKEAHGFTMEEVLLYYDMTLVDHIILSHVFESEASLNLIEVIETIKAIIVMNALTHDYLQDSTGASISLFTFLQRGGLAKDKTLEFYTQAMNQVAGKVKENVGNAACIGVVDFLLMTLLKLAQPGTTAQAPAAPAPQQAPVEPVATPGPTQIFEQPVVETMPTTAQPAQPSPVAPLAEAPVPVTEQSPTQPAQTPQSVHPESQIDDLLQGFTASNQ